MNHVLGALSRPDESRASGNESPGPYNRQWWCVQRPVDKLGTEHFIVSQVDNWSACTAAAEGRMSVACLLLVAHRHFRSATTTPGGGRRKEFASPASISRQS
jgi:hypothetical protein